MLLTSLGAPSPNRAILKVCTSTYEFREDPNIKSITSILQMKRLRYREVKRTTQRRTVGSGSSEPGSWLQSPSMHPLCCSVSPRRTLAIWLRAEIPSGKSRLAQGCRQWVQRLKGSREDRCARKPGKRMTARE